MSHNSNTAHGDSHGELGHIVPYKIFVRVFITLVILTLITVGVSRIDLGVMNIVVAMVIASIKAMIVALFFMHLKYENKLTWLYAAFPLFLLATLLAGVFIDNPFRHPNQLDPDNQPAAAVHAEAHK